MSTIQEQAALVGHLETLLKTLKSACPDINLVIIDQDNPTNFELKINELSDFEKGRIHAALLSVLQSELTYQFTVLAGTKRMITQMEGRERDILEQQWQKYNQTRKHD